MSKAALIAVLNEVLRRNRIRDGLLYLQVTRGVAPRDHLFPSRPVTPAMVVTAKSIDGRAAEAKAAKGIGVITTPKHAGRAATSRPWRSCLTYWPSRRRAKAAPSRPGSSTIWAS